jgi:hypothetical protein
MDDTVRKTRDASVPDELLADTFAFVMKSIALELSNEIDSRAEGYGKTVLRRAWIYLAALLRDFIRIPLHYYKGIGQAQFRYRVFYISNTALPTLHFFLERYPLKAEQRRLLEEAIDLLERGAGLISDGRISALDAWYATMEEFAQLTHYSREAAEKIREATKRA